ncbi:MAG: hypothetical protein ABUS57_05430 [Pseudomonadota bacterium]
MRLTDRVLALHPAGVTLLFVALFVGCGAAVNYYPFGSAASFFVFSAVMPLLLGPMLLWFYSLYRAASDRNAQAVGHSGRRAFLFTLVIIGLGAFLILNPLAFTDSSVPPLLKAGVPWLMVLGNLSYFASVWAAANALTRFDDHAKSADFSKTLGTFLLALYLPIGIWVLYPRIKRVLAEPLPAAA